MQLAILEASLVKDNKPSLFTCIQKYDIQQI